MKTLILFLCCCFQAGFILGQQEKKSCGAKEEMEKIRERVKVNRERLFAGGKLKPLRSDRTTGYNHDFVWPLVAAPNNYQPGFYYISNYVDLDNATGNDTTSLRDYNCGHRTYDTHSSGYNHDGIDIAIGPFGWKMMDDNKVYVVAAEGGVIVDKRVGEFSRTCRTDGVSNTYWGNYIGVEHSDGVTSYYLHMKEGTLTGKDTGDVVVTGEYLGVVGSSGNSSGPHLHFQVESPGGGVLDPFQNGACHDNYAGLITGSLWANEEPYENRKILSLFTLSAPYTGAACDETGVSYGYSETVPYQNHFAANSLIYFSAAVRDVNNTHPVRLRVFSPGGLELYDNTFAPPSFREQWIVPLQILVIGSDVGTYRVLCNYGGQSEAHFFTVGCPPSQTLTGSRGSNSGVISGGSINSTETISATSFNVEYQAETYIQFNPGFVAEAGSDFRARIDACATGGQKTVISGNNKK